MNKLEVPMTEEELKAKRKEAADARKAERKEALNELFELIEASGTDKMKELVSVYLPKTSRGSGSPKLTVTDEVSALFDEDNVIDEGVFFNKYKYGRGDMARICTNMIKNMEPEKRKWVSLDPMTGEYTLCGVGAKPPKDWTGYLPLDVSESDDVREIGE